MQSELLSVEEEKHRFATQSIEFARLRSQNVILKGQNDMLSNANKSIDEHAKKLGKEIQEMRMSINTKAKTNIDTLDKNLMKIASLEKVLKREQSLNLPSSSRCSRMTIPNVPFEQKEYDNVIAQSPREEEDLSNKYRALPCELCR